MAFNRNSVVRRWLDKMNEEVFVFEDRLRGYVTEFANDSSSTGWLA